MLPTPSEISSRSPRVCVRSQPAIRHVGGSNRLIPARLASRWKSLSAVVVCIGITINALPAVHYVDINSLSPTPPYTSWPTAATNIQDAVDAAVASDEIVVTNGIYSVGTRAAFGFTLNRVVLANSQQGDPSRLACHVRRRWIESEEFNE